MKRLTIKVVGEPVAQGRPRFARIGGFVRTYDPAKSVAWKDAVRLQAADYVREAGEIPFPDGPIEMMASFYLTRPKSLPKKIQYHTKKPDCSNLVKGVEDALKGIIYRDDSQIVELTVQKRYGDPGVIIEIASVDDIGGWDVSEDLVTAVKQTPSTPSLFEAGS